MKHFSLSALLILLAAALPNLYGAVTLEAEKADVNHSPEENHGVIRDTLVVNLWATDYLRFNNVDFGADSMKWMSIRGASKLINNATRVMILLDTIDTVAGTGNFDTVMVHRRQLDYSYFQLNKPIAGVHDLILWVDDSWHIDTSITQPGINIDRIGFSKEFPSISNPFKQIQCESFHFASNSITKTYPAGWLFSLARSYLAWYNMDFSSDGVIDSISIKGICKADYNAKLWILADSPDTAESTCIAKAVLGTDTSEIRTFQPLNSVSGVHDIYLVSFVKGDGFGLDWIQFHGNGISPVHTISKSHMENNRAIFPSDGIQSSSLNRQGSSRMKMFTIQGRSVGSVAGVRSSRRLPSGLYLSHSSADKNSEYRPLYLLNR